MPSYLQPQFLPQFLVFVFKLTTICNRFGQFYINLNNKLSKYFDNTTACEKRTSLEVVFGSRLTENRRNFTNCLQDTLDGEYRTGVKLIGCKILGVKLNRRTGVKFDWNNNLYGFWNSRLFLEKSARFCCFLLALCSFICQGTSTMKQRSDLFGLRVKQPPVTTSLTTHQR